MNTIDILVYQLSDPIEFGFEAVIPNCQLFMGASSDENKERRNYKNPTSPLVATSCLRF